MLLAKRFLFEFGITCPDDMLAMFGDNQGEGRTRFTLHARMDRFASFRNSEWPRLLAGSKHKWCAKLERSVVLIVRLRLRLLPQLLRLLRLLLRLLRLLRLLLRMRLRQPRFRRFKKPRSACNSIYGDKNVDI